HDMGNRYQHGIGWAKDQTKSSAWFLKSAKNGHAHAQFDIANSYYYGRGIEKDTDAAMIWARRSAAQDVSMAQYKLGQWLSEDKSNSQAIIESNKWLACAAKLFKAEASNGNKESAYRLASMYEHGEGVVENHSFAYQQYFDLASQGHLWAQYSLARMYLLGKGVDKDYPEAKRWLTEASAGGLKAADRLLEKF
ncbi:MAG: sel1 repeat family protein, partial [Proteobacteria bacterium]|nr:sel1 repeat family protein [Pseudomonadota bacterium]